MRRACCLFASLLTFALTAMSAAQGHAQTGERGPSKKSETAVRGNVTVVIETTLGTIEAELYPADAPKTVENFVRLAEKGYFNGITFHRVVRGFVIQGGDPTGTGAGGKSIWGKEFADELNPASASYKEGYKKGVLAMANRGPNTNTSQFFIMLGDTPGLPKNYTIFGKVVRGIETVDAIGNVELIPPGAREGKPKTDVVMKKVTIRREAARAKKP